MKIVFHVCCSALWFVFVLLVSTRSSLYRVRLPGNRGPHYEDANDHLPSVNYPMPTHHEHHEENNENGAPRSRRYGTSSNNGIGSQYPVYRFPSNRRPPNDVHLGYPSLGGNNWMPPSHEDGFGALKSGRYGPSSNDGIGSQYPVPKFPSNENRRPPNDVHLGYPSLGGNNWMPPSHEDGFGGKKPMSLSERAQRNMLQEQDMYSKLRAELAQMRKMIDDAKSLLDREKGGDLKITIPASSGVMDNSELGIFHPKELNREEINHKSSTGDFHPKEINTEVITSKPSTQAHEPQKSPEPHKPEKIQDVPQEPTSPPRSTIENHSILASPEVTADNSKLSMSVDQRNDAPIQGEPRPLTEEYHNSTQKMSTETSLLLPQLLQDSSDQHCEACLHAAKITIYDQKDRRHSEAVKMT